MYQLLTNSSYPPVNYKSILYKESTNGPFVTSTIIKASNKWFNRLQIKSHKFNWKWVDRIVNLKDKSIEIIITNQHQSGAYVASPNFSMYNYCWLRDGCFTAYSMDLWGENHSADKFFNWTNRVILTQASRLKKILRMKKTGNTMLNNDYLSTKFMLDGNECEDEWPNFQLDGYGTWLWALAQHIKLTGETDLVNKYRKSIKIATEYLINFWNHPNFNCWQENSDGIHTSTLASIYGGLKSINEYIKDVNVGDTAEIIKKYVEDNCTINERLKKCTDLDSIDASLLWTAIPFNIFNVFDIKILKTVEEIENTLVVDGGVHRYLGDTYYGGGQWIILSAWLGWYYCEVKELDKARAILEWIESRADASGELAEQSLEHVNNEHYINVWKSLWGDVASPVLWSHAMYLILLYNIKKIKLIKV